MSEVRRVASSAGSTGLKFARRMAAETKLVVVVSHVGFTKPGVYNFDLKKLEEIESSGGKVIKQSHVLSGLERSFTNKFSGASHTEILAEALRSLFGVGMKVAIECTIMAADSGAIPIDKTIAVGGTYTDKGEERTAPLSYGPPIRTIFSIFASLRSWPNPTVGRRRRNSLLRITHSLTVKFNLIVAKSGHGQAVLRGFGRRFI